VSDLKQYWPTTEHAAACLRTEAETVPEELLLAVHEPTTLLRRAAQTGAEVAASETELLEELMRPVTDGSAVVIAITGASGVGKSHMVRWLRAQLKRHPRRDDLVVVSIPKTASLRRVVELILEPLHEEEYEVLKRDLAKASEQLTQMTAAELLAAALGVHLEEYKERTASLIRSAPGANVALAPNVTIADHARNLILSPEARELWLSKALHRIVGASLGGTSDPADRQFRPEDLAPPEAAIGNDLPPRVQRALSFLGNSDGRFRPTAAAVLQEVLDGALRTVFGVTEALHRSIQDVVDDIRRQLLKDQKELVLLIEDLAALSGIQQPLLDIMIAESDEHGRRVRAPIRTAVAVTDGFLAGRQTVLTRAKEQWVVPSEGLGEEAIVRKVVELTGRYLNAARWGTDYLRDEFARAKDTGGDLYAWVPRFKEALNPEDSKQLDAFGFSQQGFALFPFNDLAIRGLAEESMKQGGAWNYNPRAFINEVLRKTLLERHAFLRGQFPPAGFKPARVVAEVETELIRKGYSQQQIDQLQVALCFWAGRPSGLAGKAPIHKSIFEAFSLPWPFEGDGRGTNPPPPTRAPGKPTPPPPLPPPPTGGIAEATAYEIALEKWDPASRLPNEHARETRNLLELALNRWMDFNSINIRGQKVEAGWFWLPPMATAGNPGAGLMVKVAPEEGPVPARVIAGLKALSRWRDNGRKWLYSNSESDYAAATALLGPLEAELVEAVSAEAERDAGMLAEALHVQNLLLGISSRARIDSPNLGELFAKVEEKAEELNPSTPTAVAQALVRRQKVTSVRAELQDQLKILAACVQNGNKAMGFDIDRLRRGLKCELPQQRRLRFKPRDGAGDAIADVLERTSPSTLPDLVTRFHAAVNALLPVVRDAFEADHSRVAWREAMRQTLQDALQLAVWPYGTTESQIQDAITRLSVEGIEATILKVHKMSLLPDGDPDMARLAALSAIPLPRLSDIACDVADLSRFFTEISKLIASQTRSSEVEHALAQRELLIKSLEW
jgi:hypothetical protein